MAQRSPSGAGPPHQPGVNPASDGLNEDDELLDEDIEAETPAAAPTPAGTAASAARQRLAEVRRKAEERRADREARKAAVLEKSKAHAAAVAERTQARRGAGAVGAPTHAATAAPVAPTPKPAPAPQLSPAKAPASPVPVVIPAPPASLPPPVPHPVGVTAPPSAAANYAAFDPRQPAAPSPYQAAPLPYQAPEASPYASPDLLGEPPAPMPVAVVAKKPAATQTASVPSCPAGHAAVISANRYNCDKCRRMHQAGAHYRCLPCDFDLCLACAPIAIQTSTDAPASPQLAAAKTPTAAASATSPYASFEQADKTSTESPYAADHGPPAPIAAQPKMVRRIAGTGYSAFDASDKPSESPSDDGSKESVYRTFVLESDVRPSLQAYHSTDVQYEDQSVVAAKPAAPAAPQPSPTEVATPPTAPPAVNVSEKFVKKLEVVAAPVASDSAVVQWNEEFQKICAQPALSLAQRINRSAAIRRLSQGFIAEATRWGKVIISEFSLPADSKSIKSIDAGGVAGGAKFIHRNIFFKFPDDSHNLYGGETFAMKSASHEARGIRAYLDLEIPELHVPLMTCIDYKGRRLIASSVLPIGSSSLIYGSADGAKTVLTKDPRMNALMEKAGERLNLKSHGAGPGGAVQVCGPADIEGHIGKDGLYYVVDTARVFPPEAPRQVLNAVLIAADSNVPITTIELSVRDLQADIRAALGRSTTEIPGMIEGRLYYANDSSAAVNKRAALFAGTRETLCGDAIFVLATHGFHLFYMLRPEWVRESTVPLSSDAYSGFGRADPKSQESNREVGAHTQRLMQVIHNVAEQLDNRILVPSSSPDLTAKLHAHGINNRYLGYIRSCLKNPGTNVQQLLLVTMVSRVAKTLLRSSMRSILGETGQALFEAALVSLFNLLLGLSEASTRFWTVDVKVYLLAKFDGYGSSLSVTERSKNYDLRTQVSKPLLFQTLCFAVGVKFTEGAIASAQDAAYFERQTPFSSADIAELTAKIRPIATDAQILSLLRLEAGVNAAANPTAPETLASVKKLHKLTKETFGIRSPQCAASYVELASLYSKRGDTTQALKSVEKAKVLFRVVSCSLDTAVMAYYLIGQVHLNLREFAIAESVFKGSLAVLQQFATPGHVLHMLTVNSLVETLVQQNKVKETAPYVERFLSAWRANPFRGNKDLRKQLFLREIPIALSLAVSEIGAKIDQLLENEPATNRSVQAWLEQVQAAQSIGETTLATAAIEFKISSFAPAETEVNAKEALKATGGTAGLFVSGHYFDGIEASPNVEHVIKQIEFFNNKTVVHYAASAQMHAAVLEDGSVYTWGSATFALGHGERLGRAMPTRVAAMVGKRVIRVAVGQDKRYMFLLLLTAKGDVYSTGHNRHGQLGHGDCVALSTPRLIRGLRGVTVTQIAATNLTSFAVSSSGDLYVWGSNGRGEAGLLNPALALVPTLNTNLPKEAGGVTHLATARASVMVATASGDAYVWGEHFPYTSVYNPSQGDVKTPFGKDAPKGAKASVPNQIVWTPVIALWDQNRTWRVTAVAIGHSHLLFLSDDGQVYARGQNGNGQLGQGDTVKCDGLRAVATLRGKFVVQIAASKDLSMALTSNDEVYVWGTTSEPRTYAVPTLLEEFSGKGVKQLVACPKHWTAMRQAVLLHAPIKQCDPLRLSFEVVPSQVQLGALVTLKYRLMHANSDDRFFVEPSGLLIHPSGTSTSGEILFYPDTEGDYDVIYQPVADPGNSFSVAKLTVRGSMFTTPMKHSDSVSMDPAIADHFRTIATNYGHLNFAFATIGAKSELKHIPIASLLIQQWMDDKHSYLPAAGIKEMLSKCTAPIRFDVHHETHSPGATLLRVCTGHGKTKLPALVRFILDHGGLPMFTNKIKSVLSYSHPMVPNFLATYVQWDLPIALEVVRQFEPSSELALALNWMPDNPSSPFVIAVRECFSADAEKLRQWHTALARVGFDAGLLAWVIGILPKPEHVACAQYLVEECPPELLIVAEARALASPLTAYFRDGLFQVSGRLIRTFLSKGLSLCISPTSKAERRREAKGQRDITILSHLCSSKTDEVLYDVISACTDPEEFTHESVQGSAFSQCIQAKHLRCIRFMLQLGVDPNHLARHAQPPLTRALLLLHAGTLNAQQRKQVFDLLKLLLESGADPRLVPDTTEAKHRHSPLEMARSWLFKDAVDLFLKHSPEPA